MTCNVDLVVAVADKNMKAAIVGILSQAARLGIRPVSFETIVHAERDPGARLRSHLVLSSFARTHAHALVVFDHEGCGREEAAPEQIEAEVEELMTGAGWVGRCAAVVIAPELESWVWSQSPHVADVLGWSQRQPPLADWLRAEGRLDAATGKPSDPKGTVEAALRAARVRRSSALYERLARVVSLERCTDRAFLRLKSVLRGWFGQSTG